MKVLVAHNRYQTPGGEDAVVAMEVALLRAHGVQVETFFVDNDGITGPAAKIKAALQVTYSWEMRNRIKEVFARFAPDILHVHNFFPLLSPSLYDAAKEAGCPVVQTLHNYRLLCLDATLFRKGHVCLDCVGKRFPWPGVRHGCYHGSLAGSASVALMLWVNHLRGAWSRHVDCFLMLTPFAMQFFRDNTDIPEAKMRLKPNVAIDPGRGAGGGGYALYAGRLTPEKGIGVLLEAARLGLGLPLKIAGQGPLANEVSAAVKDGVVEYVGPQSPEQIRAWMQQAAFLLLPSLWYEGLPMVIPEAFGTGLPVIASNIGSLSSLIVEGQTGLHCEPGDAAGLAAACRRLAGDAALLASMRLRARSEYDACYQPEGNCQLLLSIYKDVIDKRRESL